MRQVELHRDQVVMRRALAGMRMTLNVGIRNFLGIAWRDRVEGRTLMLLHRDPSLSVPLWISPDAAVDDAEMAAGWAEVLALPILKPEDHKPSAPRRRRCNAINTRRPKFLMRRRGGGTLDLASIHRDEQEIIARD